MEESSSFSTQLASIYKLKGFLRSGSYGDVYLANQKNSSKNLVIKRINKLKSNSEFLENEIEAGRLLSNKYVSKFVNSHEDKKYVYMVFELVEGITLYELLSIKEGKPFEENLARRITRQMLKALAYCHKKGVAHLDLKLENVMISKDYKKITVIDFGLCGIVDPEFPISTTYVGSFHYAAPEVLRNTPYDPFKADSWSVATLMFIMLYGRYPFHKEDRKKYQRGGMHPPLVFDPRLNAKVTPEAVELMKQLFNINSEERLSMTDALKHPWFNVKL